MSHGRHLVVAAFIALAIATLAGCDTFGIGDTRVFEIGPYKERCFSLVEGLCLQAREEGETEFTNLFETPSGFVYEWGFEYVILVEVRRIENPPADGSSLRRRLERVVSRRPVPSGTSFDFVAPPDRLDSAGPGLYTLAGESLTIACPTGLPCAELDALVETGSRIALGLEFSERPSDPATVTSWRECPEAFEPCSPQ